MKSVKFFSILFLICFIVSGLTVFSIVPTVNAQSGSWFPNYSSAWVEDATYSDNGFSMYNPIQFNFSNSLYYAYVYLSGLYYNADAKLEIVDIGVDNCLTGTYDLGRNFRCDGSYAGIALAFNEYGENSTISIGIFGRDTSTNRPTFFEFDLKTLSVINTVDSTGSILSDINYVCFGNTFSDSGKYGFFAVASSVPPQDYIISLSLSGCFVDGDTTGFTGSALRFIALNEYSGNIYAFIVSEKTFNIYSYTIGTRGSLGANFVATDNLNEIIERKIVNTRIDSSEVPLSAYIAHDVSVVSNSLRFKIPIVLESDGTVRCYEVLVSRSGTTITDVQLILYYSFPSDSGIIPSWNSKFQMWYSSSMINYYVYIYKWFGMPLQDDAYCPALKGGALNYFLDTNLFCLNVNEDLTVYITGEDDVFVPPSFSPPTPTPSSIGDPGFNSWLDGNIGTFVRFLVPLIFILIPSLMFAVFFGGMGLIVGALLGSIAGAIAGVIPSWAFVILLVGIVAMLFVGRSRSGNSGVSE